MGEGDDEHAGLGPAHVPRRLQVGEEVAGVVLLHPGVGQAAHRHLAQVRAGEQRPVDVDRVARAGDDGGVAVLQQHPHEVAEALLGADGVRDLELGVELDTPPALVERGDGLAQLGQAPRHRVAVVAADAGGLGQLLDRDLRRGDVRVAEAQVDHVHAGSPRLHLQVVDDREDVGREVGDPTELHAERGVLPACAPHLRAQCAHGQGASRRLHPRRHRDPPREQEQVRDRPRHRPRLPGPPSVHRHHLSRRLRLHPGDARWRRRPPRRARAAGGSDLPGGVGGGQAGRPALDAGRGRRGRQDHLRPADRPPLPRRRGPPRPSRGAAGGDQALLRRLQGARARARPRAPPASRAGKGAWREIERSRARHVEAPEGAQPLRTPTPGPPVTT